MEQSLKNRLKFGTLMLIALFLLLWLDHAAQSWTLGGRVKNGLGGVGIVILLLLITPSAVDELTTLFTAERVRPYTPDCRHRLRTSAAARVCNPV